MADYIWLFGLEGARLVWVPETPPIREYTCPGCNKRVVAKRMGNSSSYIVEHLDEKKGESGEGKCKYKGPISPKLLGYHPPKKEVSNESLPTIGSADRSQSGV